ncbi:hypothetical protein BD769DRAFT_413572 [Suillus cothurnatus]|nr:hypothetical protein BD769DRAFT_413572 [Suillus cothurnatus]
MPGILHDLPQNKKPHSSPKHEDAPRDGDGTPEKRGHPRGETVMGTDGAINTEEERREVILETMVLEGMVTRVGTMGIEGVDQAPRSPAWSDSDYSSSSDEGDNGTVYYSVDGHSSRPSSRTRSVRSKVASCSDDDVPLAQSMPTALTAQKSIRRQLRDERYQRKMQRAKGTRAVMPSERPPVPALPPTVLHGRQRSASVTPSRAPSRGERTRGRPAPLEPFPVDDLAMKLANLYMATPPSTASPSYNGIVFCIITRKSSYFWS